MSNQVYANNMEVSCKQAAGKSICAFPDVCMTPPMTPATPPGVPIPYPNTGMASDTTDGSSSVKISGQEVMLKNKSYFKKSMGDEAGCAPKKNVITSKNMGKVYFNMWSMDVKFEGENVVRMMDLTTHNHASWVGGTPPQVYSDRMAMGAGLADCDGMKQNVEQSCKDFDKPPCPDATAINKAEAVRARVKKQLMAKGMSDAKARAHPTYDAANKKVNDAYNNFSETFYDGKEGKCLKALDCFLSPESPSRCCKKQTPHHLIPSSTIVAEGGRGSSNEPVSQDFPKYKSKKAPCICAEGPSWHVGTHKSGHNKWADRVSKLPARKASLTFGRRVPVKVDVISFEDAVTAGVASAKAVAPHCDAECFRAQLNKHHLGTTTPTKKQNATPVQRTLDEPQYRTQRVKRP